MWGRERDSANSPSRVDRAGGALTPRRRDVLTLIAEGRSSAAIARKLGIAEKTVVQHVSLIYDHPGLVESHDEHRRVLAVVRAGHERR